MLDLLAAAAVAMGIGFVWYNPAVFGDKWCKQIKVEKNVQRKGGFGLSLVFTSLAHAVTMYVIHTLSRNYFGIVTMKQSLQLSAYLSLFTLAVEVPHTMFGGRPYMLYAIDKGHDVACIVAGSVVMALMQ